MITTKTIGKYLCKVNYRRFFGTWRGVLFRVKKWRGVPFRLKGILRGVLFCANEKCAVFYFVLRKNARCFIPS